MSFKDRLASKTALIAPIAESKQSDTPRAPKTAPGQMMAAMPILKEKQAELDAALAEVENLRKEVASGSTGGKDVDLDTLIEVPGRRRHMPEEKYKELRENLKRNRLIHPVAVRAMADGTYEIISGHHRVDAYRDNGQTKIRVVVDQGSDDEATDGAFFANLMQSDLTDYEKYVGFKERRARHPEMTHARLAEQSGLSETSISYILSFDHLPADVLSVCAERPTLLGASAASALASLTKKGRGNQVTEAFQRLAAGEIDQGQTVKLASTDAPKQKKTTPSPIATKIRQGKAVYCEIRQAKNVMRLQFQSEEEASRVRNALQKLLETESSAGAKQENP